MSNLGIHFDANFEYGDQFGRMAALKGRLAAITGILNPNALGKAKPAIVAADRQVLRFYNVEENLKGSDSDGSTPARNVQRAADAMAPAFSMYPDARWAYFRNEIGNFSKADFYAEEMKLWVEALAARNAYAAIGCFSFGTPDYPVWPKFDKALAAANANGGYVALHEYGVLTMRSAYDAAKGTGHHCLRYREVWRLNDYLKRFPNLRWAVTETGLDRDVNTGIGDGWRAIGKPVDQFVEELLWYDGEISKDGVTATVFEWVNTPAWWAFDINGPLVDALIAHISSGYPILEVQEPPPIVVPPVEPPPTPEPETVVVFENRFDTFAPRRFADGMGNVMIPPGLEVGYKSGGPFGQLHGELYPSREAANAPSAYIFHVVGRMNAWLRFSFPTTPGETYWLTVEVAASADVVSQSAALDPADGKTPEGISKATSKATSRTRVVTGAMATGPRMAAYWQVRADAPERVEGRIYSFKIERASIAEEPPVTRPPTPYRAVLTDALKARLGIVDTSPYLATLPAGTEVTVLDDDARRAVIEVTVLTEYLKPK